MAKITYSKLGCKVQDTKKEVIFNNQTIEVIQYLPIQEKLNLISDVITFTYDNENHFYNPVKVNGFLDLYIIEYYTNISFTDKQREDSAKLYDSIYSSGLLKEILNAIPQSELDILKIGVKETAQAIYKHQESLFGILEQVNAMYGDVSLDLNALKERLTDPAFDLIKDVLAKMV